MALNNMRLTLLFHMSMTFRFEDLTQQTEWCMHAVLPGGNPEIGDCGGGERIV